MQKVTFLTPLFFLFFASAANADITQLNESDIVKAVGSPVIKQVQEEDSPGCMTTRYTFAHELLSMKVEFKCNRINVAWFNSQDPDSQSISKKTAELAQRAVIAITQENGIEVEKALAGEVFRGKTFSNGVAVNGSCVMDTCLLTFK